MADNVEIQGLEFQIVNDSTQAVAGLQNLINTLNRLKTATNGGATSLSKTAQGIRELSNSLKGLNSGDASQKITRLTNALTALSQVGNGEHPSVPPTSVATGSLRCAEEIWK